MSTVDSAANRSHCFLKNASSGCGLNGSAIFMTRIYTEKAGSVDNVAQRQLGF